jgi:hypothetical protein
MTLACQGAGSIVTSCFTVFRGCKINSMQIKRLSGLPVMWHETDPVRKCRLPGERKAGYTGLNADKGVCFRHCFRGWGDIRLI